MDWMRHFRLLSLLRFTSAPVGGDSSTCRIRRRPLRHHRRCRPACGTDPQDTGWESSPRVPRACSMKNAFTSSRWIWYENLSRFMPGCSAQGAANETAIRRPLAFTKGRPNRRDSARRTTESLCALRDTRKQSGYFLPVTGRCAQRGKNHVEFLLGHTARPETTPLAQTIASRPRGGRL